MKCFILILILCLGFFSEGGLGEKLVSKQQLPVGKSYNLHKDEQHQGYHIFEDPVRNYEGCQCKNGNCVEENGIQVCKCLPGFGNYTKTSCKACECGPDSNCMWVLSGWMGLSSKKVCLCKPGYYEVDEKCVGPCSKNPCRNGGTCKDVENGYECVCTSNYSGKDCTEKVFHPCTSNPCKNGGNCTVLDKGFTCNCPKPYSGQTCDIGPCDKQPCLNGGTCKVGKKGYICKCNSPYSGPQCQNDPCTFNPCKNGGQCQVVGHQFKCTCIEPWTGETCEENPCTFNPCKNHGECELVGNRFNCTCIEPWTGETCEENPCTSYPCKNGGTCKLNTLSFSCDCVPPFQGELCEIGPCSWNPCKNGGMCNVEGSDFNCICLPKFKGILCEIAIGTSTSVTTESSSLMTTVLTSTIPSCDCGPATESCHFDSFGEKKCSCSSGYIPVNGYCTDCSCGYNTKTCRYNVLDEKECTCYSGYAVNQGYCEECDCGPYGSCSFENGSKRCNCKPSTVEKGGFCVVMESTTTEKATTRIPTTALPTTRSCYCGENSKSCTYNWYNEKICECFPGYAEKDDYCLECNCGPYGSCSFEYGRKRCNCKPSTIEKQGVCVVKEPTTTKKTTTRMSTTPPPTTRSCSCGENSKSCTYNWDNEKICECFPGYAVKEDYCFECNCGPYGSCKFVNDRKKCSCAPFTVEMNGVCVDVATTSTEGTTNSIITSTTAPSTIRDVSTTSSKGTSDSISTSTIISTASTVRDCSCGHNTKTCRYNVLDEKECTCYSGYAVNQGYCEECDCGPYGSCSFENGSKRCNCKPPTVEKGGFCVVIESTTTDKAITRIPTTPLPTTRFCYCGENSKSCTYNWYNEKICECLPGYAVKKDYCFECNCGPYGSCKFVNDRKKCSCAPFTVEMNGVCVECDCSKNARSCFYRRNGDKVCDCDFGYIQINGHCSAICSEEKCVHGKCEIIGNGFKCRCNEGFTGPRCTDKIQTISNKLNLWMAMQFTVAFATFLLLSGMFCFMGRMMRRSFKK